MISIGRSLLLIKCSSLEFEVKTWALYQHWVGRFISLSSEFTMCNITEICRVPSGFVTLFNPVWFAGELYFEEVDGESLKTAEKNQGRRWCLQSTRKKCWQDGGPLASHRGGAQGEWALTDTYTYTWTHTGTEQNCCINTWSLFLRRIKTVMHWTCKQVEGDWPHLFR